MTSLKSTPLRSFHVKHGARLVDFAGWEMPVQYRSILEEHKAVRHSAGLFDVSHMGEVDVRGAGALSFLQHLVTNDVSKLYPGRVLYTPMCYADGGVVDDLLVYKRGDSDFFLCINAGNIDKDLAWIREQSLHFDVSIADRSPDYALLAIQGPKAAAILQTLTDAKLDRIAYYHFGEGSVDGIPCMLSRTGYTGEDGFELYHETAKAEQLAEALLAAGSAQGLELAGLGARDSLRLEAGYPLYGHELSANISPLTAGIGWTVKLDKGCDFVGHAALVAQKTTGLSSRVVFFKTGDRRIVRSETPILGPAGSPVGRVLSGTLSPILNEAIGSALIDASAVKTSLAVDIRGARIPLQITKAPFIPLPPKVGA
jgi:aminomethyltransferase